MRLPGAAGTSVPRSLIAPNSRGTKVPAASPHTPSAFAIASPIVAGVSATLMPHSRSAFTLLAAVSSPPEMIARDPYLAKWKDGQPGGVTNPLGARALYIYFDGRDSGFRIHGTNTPKSIGWAASSGCFRMLNQDVIDLYDRVPMGAKVVVL